MTDVTLCHYTHREAVHGQCPVHGNALCLRQYAPVSVPGNLFTSEQQRAILQIVGEALNNDPGFLRNAQRAIVASPYA